MGNIRFYKNGHATTCSVRRGWRITVAPVDSIAWEWKGFGGGEVGFGKGDDIRGMLGSKKVKGNYFVLDGITIP
jgi:hypothetical protein